MEVNNIKLLSAVIVFNVLIFIYQIIIEVFSAIFRIEGIQIDKARFQVISILTGTGFTTNESELMVSTKRRRKITQIMILLSYLFNISIVSTIVNIFISRNDTSLKELLICILLTVINIILLVCLNKSTKIRKLFDNIIIKIDNKRKYKKINPIAIYDYYGNKVIAEINITNLNKKIKDLNNEILKNKYNIDLLVIKRNGNIISELEKNINLKNKDVILVFGNIKTIKKLFKRNKEIENK